MGDRKNLGFGERSDKFFGWCRRKQKERRVPSAGISPEAVPRKGGKKKGNKSTVIPTDLSRETKD
jgi:hypothetical protein